MIFFCIAGLLYTLFFSFQVFRVFAIVHAVFALVIAGLSSRENGQMGSRRTHRDDPLIRDPSADGNDFASGTTMVQQSSVLVPVIPLHIAEFLTKTCGLPLEGPVKGKTY